MRLIGAIAAVAIVFFAAKIFIFDQSGVDAADLAQYEERKSEGAAAAGLAGNRGISVDEAYQRIPHKRTAFRDDLGHMPPDEAEYLSALFQIVDSGVVERVFLVDRFRAGAMQDGNDTNYGAMVAELKGLSTPNRLLGVEMLIVQAIEEQGRYFEDWRKNGNPRYFSARAGLIQSSHRKLFGAYNTLLRLYPGEGGHNKQAFFDHLCALDFI